MMQRVPAPACGVPLHQREIGDEAVLQHGRVRQLEAAREFAADAVEHGRHHPRLARRQQHQIAGGSAAALADRPCVLYADVPQHRRAHVLLRRLRRRGGVLNRDQPRRAHRAREVGEAVHLAPRERRAARHHNPPHPSAVGDGLAEHAERRLRGDLRAVAQFESVAQVRLVRAEPLHRLMPGQPRERTRDGQVGPQRRGHVGEELLQQREDILFFAERPLQIELRELRLSVGAQVLVAEAARDLEVALNAGHHQQLLELLRRLRQRVKPARLQAARHHVVARALRRRRDHDRRLDLEEAAPGHELADALIQLVPQLQRGQHLRTPNVDVAVAHPHQFIDVDRLLVDRERRRLGRIEHLDLLGQHLDLPGRQVRIDGSLAARSHLTCDLQDVLVACLVSGGVGLVVAAVARTHDNLHHAVAVPQVEEDQPSVVAAAMHPAGQRHALADLRAAQRSAAV